MSAPIDPLPASGTSPSGGSTTDVAKGQAAQVAGSAKESGQQVAAVAKDQAATVAKEASNQIKDLYGQSKSQLTEQAGQQQQRVATGLHTLADQLSSMAEKSEEQGVATDLARQAGDRARQVAGFLQDRDPGGLVDEVKAFGRRRPAAFLAICLGAGVLAGRFLRGATASDDDSSSASSSGGPSTPTTQGYAVRGGGMPTVAPPQPFPSAEPEPGPYARGLVDPGLPVDPASVRTGRGIGSA
jgi:gas vesicle protein